MVEEEKDVVGGRHDVDVVPAFDGRIRGMSIIADAVAVCVEYDPIWRMMVTIFGFHATGKTISRIGARAANTNSGVVVQDAVAKLLHGHIQTAAAGGDIASECGVA
jgi:hypothetical protein